MKRLARSLLLLSIIVSAALTFRAGLAVTQDPALHPLVEASADRIVAATDRMLARAATPERMELLIRARLAETPRNWIALDALTEVAAERALALPPSLIKAVDDARAEDEG